MKKLHQELIKKSFIDGQLDEKSVKTIADHLNRNLLKQYIKALKHEEKKQIVLVTTPKPLTANDREKIAKLFPKKKIIEQTDPAMINGIKVVENDESYNMDLNSTFHDIIRFISNND